MTDTTTIDRDLTPNEVFTHKGTVIINGNIGQGAHVKITEGELHVTGHVQSKATVEVKGGKSLKSFLNGVNVTGGTFVGGNITVTNGRMIVDGVEVTGNTVKGGGTSAKITVDGGCGSDVTLKSDNSVEVRRACGDNLVVDCGDSFTCHDSVGLRADIDAGNSVNIAGKLGAYSKVDAGNSVGADDIQPHCAVDAGNSINANYVRSNSHVDAGNSINIRMTAHKTAVLDAGNKVRVGSYVSENDTAPTAAPETKNNGGNGGPKIVL